jgi:hypothetical protein
LAGASRTDTERQEKLFDLNTKMVAKPGASKQVKAVPAEKAARTAAA